MPFILWTVRVQRNLLPIDLRDLLNLVSQIHILHSHITQGNHNNMKFQLYHSHPLLQRLQSIAPLTALVALNLPRFLLAKKPKQTKTPNKKQNKTHTLTSALIFMKQIFNIWFKQSMTLLQWLLHENCWVFHCFSSGSCHPYRVPATFKLCPWYATPIFPITIYYV